MRFLDLFLGPPTLRFGIFQENAMANVIYGSRATVAREMASMTPDQAVYVGQHTRKKRRRPHAKRRRFSMARPDRGPSQHPFVCQNCRWFDTPTPSRPQGCRGQGVSATTRPCAVQSRGFGLFEPIEIPDEVAAVEISGITSPAALALLRWRIRRAEIEARKALVDQVRVGDQVQDHRGRCGVVVRVGPRVVRIHDRTEEWSAPCDLVVFVRA
jgi:hypothetical protein